MAMQDRSLIGLNWSTDLLSESSLPLTHGKSQFILQAPCGFTLRSNSGLDTHDSGSCSSPVATGWCVSPLECGCILSPVLFRGGGWSRPHFPFPSWMHWAQLGPVYFTEMDGLIPPATGHYVWDQHYCLPSQAPRTQQRKKLFSRSQYVLLAARLPKQISIYPVTKDIMIIKTSDVSLLSVLNGFIDHYCVNRWKCGLLKGIVHQKIGIYLHSCCSESLWLSSFWKMSKYFLSFF